MSRDVLAASAQAGVTSFSNYDNVAEASLNVVSENTGDVIEQQYSAHTGVLESQVKHIAMPASHYNNRDPGVLSQSQCAHSSQHCGCTGTLWAAYVLSHPRTRHILTINTVFLTLHV